jgi:excisionase family DNA binding protein
MALKNVYTTGEAAKVCGVSQQTIIRCFDRGELRGFRVPGSKFRRIPLEQLKAFMRENSIPIENLSGTYKKKVVAVDDEESIIDLLKDVIGEDNRFELRTASTGFAAGALIQEFRPDIILLDFKLPDVNGTEVCRYVRANPELVDVKIIMISGVAHPDEIQKLRESGADVFIKKPFEISHLLESMSELVGLS